MRKFIRTFTFTLLVLTVFLLVGCSKSEKLGQQSQSAVVKSDRNAYVASAITTAKLTAPVATPTAEVKFADNITLEGGTPTAPKATTPENNPSENTGETTPGTATDTATPAAPSTEKPVLPKLPNLDNYQDLEDLIEKQLEGKNIPKGVQELTAEFADEAEDLFEDFGAFLSPNTFVIEEKDGKLVATYKDGKYEFVLSFKETGEGKFEGKLEVKENGKLEDTFEVNAEVKENTLTVTYKDDDDVYTIKSVHEGNRRDFTLTKVELEDDGTEDDREETKFSIETKKNGLSLTTSIELDDFGSVDFTLSNTNEEFTLSVELEVLKLKTSVELVLKHVGNDLKINVSVKYGDKSYDFDLILGADNDNDEKDDD